MQRARSLHLSHLQNKPERKQGLPKDSEILTGQHLGGEGRQVAMEILAAGVVRDQ